MTSGASSSRQNLWSQGQSDWHGVRDALPNSWCGPLFSLGRGYTGVHDFLTPMNSTFKVWASYSLKTSFCSDAFEVFVSLLWSWESSPWHVSDESLGLTAALWEELQEHLSNLHIWPCHLSPPCLSLPLPLTPSLPPLLWRPSGTDQPVVSLTSSNSCQSIL